MRDAKRIPQVLKEIEKLWKEQPDLRLGQLIANVVAEDYIYFIEDEKLVEVIKEFYHPTEDKE